MNESEVTSDLIFLGNKVSMFNLATYDVERSKQAANVSFDFDYRVKRAQQHENTYFGIIEFQVKVNATLEEQALFTIDLVMEGAFKSETLNEDEFKKRLIINGLIVLSHISQAYIQSVTAQSGINPPVRMPMLNVKKLIEKKAQSKGEGDTPLQ